jgi:outer membrane protein OmpA-like peptidoglycan-associated protein
MRVIRLAVVAMIAVLSLPALAQTTVVKSFSTQLFEPAIGQDVYFGVEGPGITASGFYKGAFSMGFNVGLLFNYQHHPLVLYTDTKNGTTTGGFDVGKASSTVLVSSQMTTDLIASFGLTRGRWLNLQAGIGLPINLYMSGNNVSEVGVASSGFSQGGVGDLRLQLKWLIVQDWKGLSFAFSPILTFPTASNNTFGGEPGNVSFRPRVVLGYSWKNLFAAANLGYLVRQSTLIFSSEIGNQLLYGVGVGYKFHPRLLALAELNGRSGIGSKSGCVYNPTLKTTTCSDTSSNDLDANPLETDFGVRVPLAMGFEATGGVGVGIIRAVGTPSFRVLAGLRWAPDYRDSDGDGVPDAVDRCPTEPEDKDGFQDEDGCPDPDNDGDMIPDSVDKCPNEPEDKDGFQDDDGCPEPDNDGDKIPDIKDACPNQPETYNGYRDDDGCPDEPDRDNDNVPDAVDKCPDEPEDKDGFQDDDGCPDPDNDGDGVPDKFDDCPNDAEDMDGFKDDDGCPDPDNDGDGICDPWVQKQGLSKKYAHICRGSDKCPNEAETINGYQDDDGCPDKGNSHVKIEEGKVVITKKIFFDTSKATIKKISNRILDELAAVLLAHQEIKGVRVEGHTDSQGDAKKNKELSQHRAEAVRTYLIGKGVAAGRLFAIGYGPEKPIAENKTAKGREQNRRVEFVILEQGTPPGTPKKAAPADDKE